MSSAPSNAGEGVLVAIQDAALGLARPFDSEQATRFEAALEALSPNTRRAYGGALAAWGQVGGVAGRSTRWPRRRLRCAPTCRNGRRAATGISSLRMTVAALRKVQALVGVEPSAHDQVVTDTISGLARQAAAPRQAYALDRAGAGGCHRDRVPAARGPRRQAGIAPAGAAARPGRYRAVPGAVGRGPAPLGGGGADVG